MPKEKVRIFWLDHITNKELWKRMKQPWTDLHIRKRKWGWPGHTLWKPSNDIARQALEWKIQGIRGRGKSRNTWRRKVLEEAKGVKKTWAGIIINVKNTVRWRILVEALCSAAEWWDLWFDFLKGLTIKSHNFNSKLLYFPTPFMDWNRYTLWQGMKQVLVHRGGKIYFTPRIYHLNPGTNQLFKTISVTVC